MAKWVLIGVAAAGLAAVVVKELPAMRRELKIMSM
jgi:hypothetical protein